MHVHVDSDYENRRCNRWTNQTHYYLLFLTNNPTNPRLTVGLGARMSVNDAPGYWQPGNLRQIQ